MARRKAKTPVVDVLVEKIVPNVIVQDEPIFTPEKPTTNLIAIFGGLKGIEYSMLDYAGTVGEVEAIRLLQKCLSINKTGTVDATTRQAYGAVSDKIALIDDYNSLRRDNYKDMAEVKTISKAAFRL